MDENKPFNNTFIKFIEYTLAFIAAMHLKEEQSSSRLQSNFDKNLMTQDIENQKLNFVQIKKLEILNEIWI